MQIKSKALEVNLADYHVDVAIDSKYIVLQEIMSKYYGLMDGFNTFLKELSHPYKNWQFIIKEARGYSLDYFHLLKNHEDGPEAAAIFADIFEQALRSDGNIEVRNDSSDALLLFLLKIITEAQDDICRFMPVINHIFNRITYLPDDQFLLFAQSYYSIARHGELLLNYSKENEIDLMPVNRLLTRCFQVTYDYWLKIDDPCHWFCQEAEIRGLAEIETAFEKVSHQSLMQFRDAVDGIFQETHPNPQEVLQKLLALHDHNDIVEMYRRIPVRLLKIGESSGKGNQWKVIFLFYIMNISGLFSIHEETLREINRSLTWLISREPPSRIHKLIGKTFSILKEQTVSFPVTALNCILNVGKGVYQTDDMDLIKFFIDSVIDLGFQYPCISGVGNDWQIQANTAHIQNIRTWMELIKLNPKWSTRLISYLIIHLSLSGVFIKDTDLFPRDVTHLLNSNIDPVYNLIKQLVRIFPVFFNEIGAEGKLREISTQIDEITHRKDVLIHFLRKQSHVESSNRMIGFMEAVLDYFSTRDKRGLAPYVPPGIYNQIETTGVFIDGVFKAFACLKEKGVKIPGGLLKISGSELKALLNEAPGILERDRERTALSIEMYRMLCQKYNLNFVEMNNYLDQLQCEAFPDIAAVKAALNEPDLKKKILMLLDYLEQLKDLILSPESYEIREDIYNKRHFTVDIPSMYGSYHELKFDAMGLTLRIESYLNVLFEELINSIDLTLITKATFYQIYDRIRMFERALKVDGISSVEIERQLDFLAHSLEIKGFSFTQYLDIFKGFAQAVKNIINDYFNNVHEQNLTCILDQIGTNAILPKYLPNVPIADQEKLKYRISEIFFRDRIALSLGLQQLDLFLSRILNTLFHQAEKLFKENLHLLLNYDPDNAVTTIDNVGSRVKGIIYLGNKGLNLVKLNDFGLPIPPGFIITTEIFRCRDIIESYRPAEQNFREQILREILRLEEKTRKRFGSTEKPLLFSVRSGSSISQPGMMDTFLDVGMNLEITEGMARKSGNEWFAWDNYRRFLQCYGMSFGLERDNFDAIISSCKQKWGIPFKRDFSGKQMHETALSYREYILDNGVVILEDPFEQLYMIIKKVLDSWQSPKARAFRKIMGISDDWGTAVTVQEMVYGNLSRQSGSGVFFTHNPRWSEDSLRLWGDFTLGNQGEDVVSGLVNTLPISLNQQNIEMRGTDITLETHFPAIYLELKEWANELVYRHGWSPQEIEFTFESPDPEDLYLLQTRDMAIRERKKVFTFDYDAITEESIIGHGIGVSGGAMAGRVVFTLEEIDQWHKKEPKTALVLIRADTVPDDIKEIYAADGILTARGGLTSHAAVVAHRLGKVCVVGCGEMICNEKQKTCQFPKLLLRSGDFISIDGQEGSVYQGALKVKES
ncbi:MAG: PEP/pyruvate-binding domain-containing protein [Desulfobacterales bacterium]